MPSASAVRSGPEWQSCYESLRRQVLEPESGVRGPQPEPSRIEREGVAAWLANAPERPVERVEAASPHTGHGAEAGPPRSELILALADLVLGDRQAQRRIAPPGRVAGAEGGNHDR
jgi:hypothetical protein